MKFGHFKKMQLCSFASFCHSHLFLFHLIIHSVIRRVICPVIHQVIHPVISPVIHSVIHTVIRQVIHPGESVWLPSGYPYSYLYGNQCLMV